MTTLIALLRGINVIGNNKLPMRELSALMTGIGMHDVQTYIQSGNVVFRGNVKNKAALAAKISAAIEAQHGFAPQVLLLDAEELHQAMAGNPYPEAVSVPRTLHLFFLAEATPQPDLKALEAIRTASERFKLAVLPAHAGGNRRLQTCGANRKDAGRGCHRAQLEHGVQAGGNGCPGIKRDRLAARRLHPRAWRSASWLAGATRPTNAIRMFADEATLGIDDAGEHADEAAQAGNPGQAFYCSPATVKTPPKYWVLLMYFICIFR